MDLNCQTVTLILTPLQAAHYMLQAYPQHCDALALRWAGGRSGAGAGGRLAGVARWRGDRPVRCATSLPGPPSTRSQS